MKYYLTAAIPYVNAKPHLGHALEFVQGDVIARYHRLMGDKTLYLTGADENALKIVQAAEKTGKTVQEFCDENAVHFQDLLKHYNVTIDVFERASSTSHHTSSQKLWKLCETSGDIYKKSYEGLYCVGCEAFYTADELNEQGECFEHPGRKLDKVTEENYFFKLSKYAKEIASLISSNTVHIVPDEKKNEMLGFLKGEVQDISISRSKERAKNWGVEVPGDPSQILYVWFDALNVYQSGIGFGHNEEQYKTWWPADAHLIGKGITRFHAVYWIAMLLSAKLQLPKNIFVHGYITVSGQKMSKTLGNVIDPEDLLKTFPVDVVRYYFLREMSTTEDGDFTFERCKETYNAHLANELGNLASRTAKLCSTLTLTSPIHPTYSQHIGKKIDAFQLKEAFDAIWENITALNKTLTDKKPWELAEPEKITLMSEIRNGLLQISFDLQPFMPSTAEKLVQHFSQSHVSALTPLFPKLSI